MTRKDYERLATALNEGVPQECLGVRPEPSIDEKIGYRLAVAAIIRSLKADNAAFNVGRFLNAVYDGKD